MSTLPVDMIMMKIIMMTMTMMTQPMAMMTQTQIKQNVFSSLRWKTAGRRRCAAQRSENL